MENVISGTLYDRISRNNVLTEEEAAKHLLELISGIEYLHQSSVCHRDLKPENMLLDYDNTLKIADFNLSNMYATNDPRNVVSGSANYAAPEVRNKYKI